MTQVNQLLISYGGLFLFAMAFVEQSGLPLPAAPWLLAAGALAADGKLRLFGAIGYAALGCLAADLMWFRLGLQGKGQVFRVFPDLESIKHMIPPRPHTRLFFLGVRRLTAAKFLPFGTIVPLRAGALEIGSLAFLVVDALSSVLYAAVYVLLGFSFHSQLEEVVAFVQRLGVVAFLLLVIAVVAYVRYAMRKRKSKRPQDNGQSHELELPRPASESQEPRPVGMLAHPQPIKCSADLSPVIENPNL